MLFLGPVRSEDTFHTFDSGGLKVYNTASGHRATRRLSRQQSSVSTVAYLMANTGRTFTLFLRSFSSSCAENYRGCVWRKSLLLMKNSGGSFNSTVWRAMCRIHQNGNIVTDSEMTSVWSQQVPNKLPGCFFYWAAAFQWSLYFMLNISRYISSYAEIIINIIFNIIVLNR